METDRGVLKRKLTVPPWLALYLLAPFFGEVVSGSTTPIELVNIVGAVFLTFLYGGGALLIREAKTRLNKGWSFVFLWGCAYGILEEGLCCKSFFDPKWPDIDKLGIYGRYIGVNWVWVFFLILFHACVSIMLPIYLTERLYKVKSQDTWADKKGLAAAAILLALTAVMGYNFFPDGKNVYFPPVQMIVGSVAAIALFTAIGLRMPSQPATTHALKVKTLAFLGFVSYTLFLLCMFCFPISVFNPIQAIAISTVVFVVLGQHIQRCWGPMDTQASFTAFMKGLFISFSLWCVAVDMKSGFLTGSVFVPFILYALYRRTRNAEIASAPA